MTEAPLRHPVTGRFMAGDCERDCLEHCAGLCGADLPELTRPLIDAGWPVNDQGYPGE